MVTQVASFDFKEAFFIPIKQKRHGNQSSAGAL